MGPDTRGEQASTKKAELTVVMHGEGESELMAEPNSVVWGVMFPSYSYIEITRYTTAQKKIAARETIVEII